MSQKQYLIYLDILGFDGLAAEIAEKKGIESRKVREDFIDVITERVETIEEKGKIIGQSYSRRDDWLLIADSLEKVFTSILEILDHNTGYVDYMRIPLEIVVGIAEFDEWARFEAEKLIIQDATIEFLKIDIVHYYRKWYEECHDGQKLKATFIILTESACQQLEPLDRKTCRKIEYKHNKKTVKFFVADVGRVQQRGRVFEFLEKIGRAGSKWYDRIDDVYISPLEYEGIVRTLEEKRVVLITGTPEYGKTYTTVRLMWEYYNHGYEPRWIRGGERDERIEVRQKLEDIRTELKPRHIIYFEDPFGKTQYERRESLEREIGTIIESIRQVDDAYVLITSREEVFKEFEKEKLSANELREFEKKLNIKKPSYDYEKRAEILLKWAEAENCKWLANKKLENLVLESMKHKEILPTPLSIRSFVTATIGIEKEDELREKIAEKSAETEKAFAEEIRDMTEDKILFLSFMFVPGSFEVKFVRKAYQDLVERLGLEDAWEFDRVLDWFKDDKIEIIDDKYLGFSHPSYSKSLEHILVEDGYITQINKKIFSKLLLELSVKDEGAWPVAFAVARHFDKLPRDVRNELLLRLSEKDGPAWLLTARAARHFIKLPRDVRNELLLRLSEKDSSAWGVAGFVTENFDRLSEGVGNRLLLKLSEKDQAASVLARFVTENFDRLPEEVRNRLLLKLAEKDESTWLVAGFVTENFDRLPEEARNRLLLKLSEDVEAAGEVARFVADKFDKLPEEARNLLFKLSKKGKTAWLVAGVVADKFDKLPEEVRNRLLLELAEDNSAAGKVAWVVVKNFDRLPEEVRNLLFKLRDWDVVFPVALDSGRLPQETRNELLLKLSENEEVRNLLDLLLS